MTRQRITPGMNDHHHHTTIIRVVIIITLQISFVIYSSILVEENGICLRIHSNPDWNCCLLFA